MQVVIAWANYDLCNRNAADDNSSFLYRIIKRIHIFVHIIRCIIGMYVRTLISCTENCMNKRPKFGPKELLHNTWRKYHGLDLNRWKSIIQRCKFALLTTMQIQCKVRRAWERPQAGSAEGSVHEQTEIR